MPLGLATPLGGVLLLQGLIGVLSQAYLNPSQSFLSPAPGLPGILQEYKVDDRNYPFGNSALANAADQRRPQASFGNNAASSPVAFNANDFTLPDVKTLTTPPQSPGSPNAVQIDTAAAAIYPLADIMADSSQTQKNSEHTIGVYQDTLEKMFREVTQQKEKIKASDELIKKLQNLQEANKKNLAKNEETVKKYSQGLVDMVTQYTSSLSGTGSDSAEGAEKSEKSEQKASFLQKLEALKRHAAMGP